MLDKPTFRSWISDSRAFSSSCTFLACSFLHVKRASKTCVLQKEETASQPSPSTLTLPFTPGLRQDIRNGGDADNACETAEGGENDGLCLHGASEGGCGGRLDEARVQCSRL